MNNMHYITLFTFNITTKQIMNPFKRLLYFEGNGIIQVCMTVDCQNNKNIENLLLCKQLTSDSEE